ncbi:phospho-sugar mutase [Brevibacillus humidisoli]|uniref:phospho-sugar mutase n=1 Tax=Brevibacillus humidisoli TaxID=2895522 RepID=UPI001E5A1A44|nr:phospho-sugar mutase [Brevibacillus humidisoli]UFJ39613.1 phospho-sugar mutase [Brevibacillus humidisoli]
MRTDQLQYQRWLNEESLDPTLKEELRQITEDSEIAERFHRYLDFGTAGLRGLIGAGTNRMNIYTIRRATAGLAGYLKKQNIEQKGIVIAYDTRNKSRLFAQEAAGVLSYLGIPVYLFAEVCPTPILSFAVRYLHAAGGIVITASHNPPQYNGFKVYNKDGAQIPDQAARAILEEISRIPNEFTIPVLPLEDGQKSRRIRFVGVDVYQAYYQNVYALSLLPVRERGKSGQALSIVYTPLHGTGTPHVCRVLQQLDNIALHLVAEQSNPDPFFSTLSTPNPEDPAAYSLAIRTAETSGADIIFATDPDADRLGIMGRNDQGEYVLFNGNQIGALLLSYVLERKNQLGVLPQNGVMLKTIVTSDLGRAIAAAYGIETCETLTGFKYIAEKVAQLGARGSHSFLFGYEESCGYLIGDFVLDKDAVQTAYLAAEMALYFHAKGQTLYQALQEIYQTYGYYREEQLSVMFQGSDGAEQMNQLMSCLRQQAVEEYQAARTSGIAIKSIKDYANGLDGQPPANVLTYMLADGSAITFRPSGTEPKLKVYLRTTDRTQQAAEAKLLQLQAIANGMLS